MHDLRIYSIIITQFRCSYKYWVRLHEEIKIKIYTSMHVYGCMMRLKLKYTHLRMRRQTGSNYVDALFTVVR